MDGTTPSTARRALLLVAMAALLLAACAAGPNGAAGVPAETGRVAGFWLGLWHGVIAPITFVISLFGDGVNVYEIHNNGGWYDFGFVLGAVCLIGGSHGARRHR
ncbi:MAG: hypothetical protein KQH83_06035 [Actinobacteria bacterium]|nr:hypothetical protein [Actinomycetota bacterium]